MREAAFGPDEIVRLTTAYEAVLRSLNLTDRTDPVTEIVAKKVLEVAISEHDPARIHEAVLERLGLPNA